MNIDKGEITGVILAGGQARRMGGRDKGLILLNDKPMIEYIIKAFEPQTSRLIINANRNHEQYKRYSFDVISDELEDYCGPLAGMASALQIIDTQYMVTVPCDSPFVPTSLVQRLKNAILDKSAEISVAHDGNRIQPVFCMINSALKQSMSDYLAAGERKIDRWFEQHSCAIADFSDVPETFDNINTAEDIQSALSKMVDL